MVSPDKQSQLPNLHEADNDISKDIAEIFSKRYRGMNIFAWVLVILSIMIVATGIKVAEQTQQYYQNYRELQSMKREYRKMQVEHQRLLIEQQTFSATPLIAQRAINELHMHYPNVHNRLVLQPVATDIPVPTQSQAKQISNQHSANINKNINQGGNHE